MKTSDGPAPTPAASSDDASEQEVVLEVLDGCGPSAAREAHALGAVRAVGPTELRLRLPAENLASVRELRCVVSAYPVVPVAARRPREILETSTMRRIGEAIAGIRRLRPRSAPFTGLRIAAAGSGTPEMRRIAEELGVLTGLPVAEDGDLLVRVRPAPGGSWEVLPRLTPRPLATRAWRTVDYPGAVNASIAASVLDLMEIGAEDSLLDMTCGSGTFLIEQLHRAVPPRAVGVDISAPAIEAAVAHQRAARRKGRIDWIRGDVLTEPIEPGFTRILTNPPWGTLHGEHETNQALLAALLVRAEELSAPGARLGVLTHEIRRMHEVIDDQSEWRLLDEHRFFQKGHHPRLFRFERAR